MEYTHWCVSKFLMFQDNIRDIKNTHLEYVHLARGLKFGNDKYRTYKQLNSGNLEELLYFQEEIKTQTYLFYIILMRNYKLIWRPTQQDYNYFSIYFRFSIFSLLGAWLRRRIEITVPLKDNIVIHEEFEQYEYQKPEMSPKEIASLCMVTKRQINKLFSNKYSNIEKLVDTGYLNRRDTNNVNSSINKTNLAQNR